METLFDIGREAHAVNRSNKWDVFAPTDFPEEGTPAVQKLCTHMALVHSEVSEATEAIRNNDFRNFREELADIIIRVASIAYGLDADLDSIVAEKIEKNKTRGEKHGGKLV